MAVKSVELPAGAFAGFAARGARQDCEPGLRNARIESEHVSLRRADERGGLAAQLDPRLVSLRRWSRLLPIEVFEHS